MARKGKARAPDKVAARTPEKAVPAEDGLYRYQLQSGETIIYRPINPDLRQAIFDQYPEPEVPMQEVPTIDGGVELIPDPSDVAYQEGVADAARERAKALIRLLVVQSLAELEPPDDWKERQQWVLPGWEPPDDPLELKLYWVQNWLLGPMDLAGLLQAAQLASALTPEEVERQLRSFRTEMARAIGETLGDTLGEALAQLRAGDDIRSGVGEDSVADVPGDG